MGIANFKMKVALALAASVKAGRMNYVIGGNIVGAHSEPYILSMQRFSSHFCGGSIVSGTKGICAAHCRSSSSVTAVAGAHNIRQNEASQQKVGATFRNHPQYNSNTIANDIAVLTFASSLNFNEYVQPISLPTAQSDEWMTPDTPARVCGWGNTSMVGTSMPSELHCVNTKIVSNAVCNSGDSYGGSILKGMFCAGEYGVGGKDACQGDSGGPVTINFSDNDVGTLVGATSWGFGCAYPKYPGVYTDVAVYRTWVDSQM